MEEIKVWMQRISRSILFMLLLGSSHVAVAACLTSIAASTPTSQFTDHGNGTVTDNKTGLMWKQCTEGFSGVNCATGVATGYSWQGALQLAETLNAGGGFAGYTDWRLPNLTELASIVEDQCNSPAINATLFPNTASGGFYSYWSATPHFFDGATAWYVHFQYGGTNTFSKAPGYYVRLVRGGL